MRLTPKQRQDIVDTNGIYVNTACDKCGQVIGPWNLYTRFGELGEWCSRLCRDGKEEADRWLAKRRKKEVKEPMETPKVVRGTKKEK